MTQYKPFSYSDTFWPFPRVSLKQISAVHMSTKWNFAHSCSWLCIFSLVKLISRHDHSKFITGNHETTQVHIVLACVPTLRTVDNQRYATSSTWFGSLLSAFALPKFLKFYPVAPPLVNVPHCRGWPSWTPWTPPPTWVTGTPSARLRPSGTQLTRERALCYF